MSPTIPPDPDHVHDHGHELSHQLSHQLSDAELKELDRFLASPKIAESSLDIFGLEGFLAAVLASPREVEPAEWMPWIWDVDRGEISPEWEGAAEQEHILGLVTRLGESVRQALVPGAGEFLPLFDEGDVEAATNWCSGFAAGTRFESDAWSERIDERPKWFTPILALGLEDDGGGPAPRKSQIERWARDVGPAVEKIREYWIGGMGESQGAGAARAPRAAVGRNEPCPCGSGKKFKRCCGAGPG
ncbi:MAG: UPF0149 family protein [Thermoanaerobaculia bacterium]